MYIKFTKAEQQTRHMPVFWENTSPSIWLNWSSQKKNIHQCLLYSHIVGAAYRSVLASFMNHTIAPIFFEVTDGLLEMKKQLWILSVHSSSNVLSKTKRHWLMMTLIVLYSFHMADSSSSFSFFFVPSRSTISVPSTAIHIDRDYTKVTLQQYTLRVTPSIMSSLLIHNETGKKVRTTIYIYTAEQLYSDGQPNLTADSDDASCRVWCNNAYVYVFKFGFGKSSNWNRVSKL